MGLDDTSHTGVRFTNPLYGQISPRQPTSAGQISPRQPTSAGRWWVPIVAMVFCACATFLVIVIPLSVSSIGEVAHPSTVSLINDFTWIPVLVLTLIFALGVCVYCKCKWDKRDRRDKIDENGQSENDFGRSVTWLAAWTLFYIVLVAIATLAMPGMSIQFAPPSP